MQVSKAEGQLRSANSLLLRRFPQFNSVSIGIHDPRKLSVVGALAMRINLNSRLLQLLQQSVQIIHAIVQHEAGFARAKILRGSRKDCPSRRTLCTRLASVRRLQLAPLKGSALSVRLALYAKMLLIPFIQIPWVLRLKKDSTNSCHTFHEGASPLAVFVNIHRGKEPRIDSGFSQVS